jgi:hypothetical protein
LFCRLSLFSIEDISTKTHPAISSLKSKRLPPNFIAREETFISFLYFFLYLQISQFVFSQMVDLLNSNSMQGMFAPFMS